MSLRFPRMAAALAALALTAAACGDSSAGEDGDVFRVLVLGGLTAEGTADNAAMSVNSAKAGFELVNETGGIDGRQVEVTVVDDQGDPTRAVSKVREAIAENRPDLVLNSGPSTIAEATLPILKQNNILSFNTAPTATSADPDEFPLNFDFSPGVAEFASAFVPPMQENGYTTVGILHGSSGFGQSMAEEGEKAITAAGLEVVALEEYDVTALDMTAQLEKIKSKNPDVLFFDGYGAPVGYVLKGIEKLGWDVPVMGDASVSATSLVSAEPPTGLRGTGAVENLVVQLTRSIVFDPEATIVNDAVARLKELGEIKATLQLAYNYDAAILVQAAANDAKSIDSADLAAALEDPAVQANAKTAILSRYNFDGSSHTPRPGPEEFIFISPSALEDGQFRP